MMDIKYKKEELNLLLYLGKRILDKRVFKKIVSIRSIDEKRDVLKYSIRSKLESDFFSLKKEVSEFKKKGVDVFSLEIKLSLLNSKIKYFNVSHSKSDFKEIMGIFYQVRRGLKYV